MCDIEKPGEPHTGSLKDRTSHMVNTAVIVTVIGRGEECSFEYNGSISLMQAILAHGIYLSASCGGLGTCGKCKLRLVEGKLAITSSDRAKLSDQELKQGYRLSCTAFPTESCKVLITSGDESDFAIVAGTRSHQEISTDEQDVCAGNENSIEDYGIAIDIGTTTLALSLVRLNSKQVIDTYTGINKQRAYGADVITRIKASVEGKKEILRKSIQEDLQAGIHTLRKNNKIEVDQLKQITIAGNTTMLHLLLGYSCETLGSYPFAPVNINTVELTYYEVFGSRSLNAAVTILPGISAFVGADIVAGLFACDFDQAEKPSLLIDLGTNGEMALGNYRKLLVTSTAAGPAFEGGNISCGIGSVSGAICNVEISNGISEVETIGRKSPIGICGTGVIELASELLKSGLMDETGLLCEKYFEQGYPVTEDSEGNKIIFTQRDIRELQLAKAAIRAGMETLLNRYGITFGDIDTVYLAGGFGYHMNLEKAFHIGLLPMELSGHVKTVGNTSLEGAVRYLTEPTAAERMKQIISSATEIHLSNDEDFNSRYIQAMGFDS